MADTEWDLAVVGAGIAGLSAARAAAAHGLSVVAYDRLSPGGQLLNISTVHEFPGLSGKSGADLMAELLETAMDAGVEIGYGEVTGVRPGPPLGLDTSEGGQRARAVVVATGLTPGRLGLPGEDDLVGRGISSCASCDGPLFAGKDVAVVGSDEWTAQEALELAEVAARVTVLVADDAPGWSAARGEQLDRTGRVDVVCGTTVTAVSGDGSLAGLTVRRDDAETQVAVGGLFTYSGRRGEQELLDGAVAADANGRLISDSDLATAVPGVFIAGDVRAGAVPWLVAAAGDGIGAGLAAVAHVRSAR